jgi:hypothetical protein
MLNSSKNLAVSRVLAMGALLLLVSTLLHARDFRSSDVHPADYPTVVAVGLAFVFIHRAASALRKIISNS